ncbi:MAG: hypothetical protein ABL891_08055 [Burkholderiales bacterium]
MVSQRFRAAVLSLLMGLAFSAYGADFRHENKPQNLKALFERIHHEAHVKKDNQQAAALFRSLMPDQARVKKALKDDIAPDLTRQIADMHVKLGGTITPDGIGKVARATQKEVQVHGATTEEIMRYRDGSVAFKEFPGGTKRVAEQALRPGVTFYEVEYLEPGKSAGMKYHLLYWDGKQWSMLGPVWRVMKQ